MDPGFSDLELQLAKFPNDLASLKALRRLAAAAGNTNAEVDEAFLEIHWAIEGLEHRILRESKIHGRVQFRNETEDERNNRVAKEKRLAKEKELAARPTDYIARLVRIAAYRLGKLGQPRRGKQEATKRVALEDFPLVQNERRVNWNSELRSAEKRAIEIIQGAKRNAKKNDIEEDAIALADAVIADFTIKPKTGRPAGRPNVIFDVENFQHNLQLTVLEVIEAVLPTITRLAGREKSSSPTSMMIAAVAAAVRSAGLKCETGLAADIVRKLRRP